MTIKKGGLLYKIAYGLNGDSNLPNQTNLCPFFWKLMFMIFLGWPLYYCVILPLLYGILAMYSVIGFLFGYRLESEYSMTLIRCQKWPEVKGYRILPIDFIIGAGLAWGLTLYWLCIVLLVLLVLAAVITGLLKFLKTEAWQVLKAYLAAKKAKVCPIIKFE